MGIGEGTFRNSPGRGIFLMVVYRTSPWILRTTERLSCARGAAWRSGNGTQRREGGVCCQAQIDLLLSDFTWLGTM